MTVGASFWFCDVMLGLVVLLLVINHSSPVTVALLVVYIACYVQYVLLTVQLCTDV